MKKLRAIIGTTILSSVLITSNVFAYTGDFSNQQDKKHNHSEVIYSSDTYNLRFDRMMQDNTEMIDWGCGISELSERYINVNGVTESYKIVDEIGYNLYVQKYENGSWSTIKTFSYSKNDSDEARGNHQLIVEGGKNYRVKSINYVIIDGKKTSETVTTKSISVN